MPDPAERSPIAQSPLSVLLLAPPGAPDLAASLESWDTLLAGLGRPYEILFSPTGADEPGKAPPETSASNRPAVRVLPPPKVRGVGAAIRAGLARAHHPLFVYAECSGRYPPAELGKLLEVIDHVDLVSGVRQA